MFDRERC